MSSQIAITQLLSGAVNFAVSSVDLNTAGSLITSNMNNIQQIPVLVSAVVFVTNFPVLAQVNMVWSREIVVGVCNGSITTWNHRMIQLTNPFIYLPNTAITFVLLKQYVSLFVLPKQLLI